MKTRNKFNYINRPLFIRHIYIMCEDRAHLMFCLENIER